jgi:hypothetical protein
MFFFSRKGL